MGAFRPHDVSLGKRGQTHGPIAAEDSAGYHILAGPTTFSQKMTYRTYPQLLFAVLIAVLLCLTQAAWDGRPLGGGFAGMLNKKTVGGGNGGSDDEGNGRGDVNSVSSRKEREQLYEAYNHLHTLAQDFHKPFDAPAVIVVGHQTSGKSALIEALMGFQFNQVSAT